MPDLDPIREARIYLSQVAEQPAPALCQLVADIGPVTAAEHVRTGAVSEAVDAETRAPEAAIGALAQD